MLYNYIIVHTYFISTVSCFGLTSSLYLVSTFPSVAILAQDDWPDDCRLVLNAYNSIVVRDRS